ncbi:hypothetical protein FB45DRAFT_945933 [Roridomyces roridus]|uniref:Uncharacterized protein n=1 Tax=Roridomyces roridus TaxID=1738132 RepID=A0AAD7FBD5_9AGAR|nr:hypothetical protein FB45DRAFT_945933 [Roridomyces roridus]
MATLPPELEREIFEYALISSKIEREEYSRVKSTLSLVCQRVHQWTQIFFYRSFGAKAGTDVTKFLRLVARMPPGFSDRVKELRFGHRVPHPEIIEMVSACNKAEQLACFVEPATKPDLPLLIRQLPLTRLWIEHSHFLSVASLETPPKLLPALTHLYLVFWDRRPIKDITVLTRNILRLPSLTHLALSFTPSNPALVKTICAALPDLHIIVVTLGDNTPNTSQAEYSFDPRIAPVYEAVFKENDISDCNILWADAARFIAQRRAADRSG